jgi:hypothetical protein
MLWLTGFNWYHRASDAIDDVSHKPMSLNPGSTYINTFFITNKPYVCG